MSSPAKQVDPRDLFITRNPTGLTGVELEKGRSGFVDYRTHGDYLIFLAGYEAAASLDPSDEGQGQPALIEAEGCKPEISIRPITSAAAGTVAHGLNQAEGEQPDLNISSTTIPPIVCVDETEVAPAECDHQWTNVGEDLFTCTACGLQKDHIPGWRDMATAPRDGTMLRLLVSFTDHSTSAHGHNLQAPTIGYSCYDLVDSDRWEFAGENWDGSGFTAGQGEPVGWLPMLEAPKKQTQPVTKEMEWVPKALRRALWHAESLNTEALNLRAWIQAELARQHDTEARP